VVMTDEGLEPEVLDEAACLRLLSSAPIGRIAFTQDALPAIQPVVFAVAGGEVFIPTHQGSRVAAASREAVVAFQADEFDVRAGTGWSVTVVGPSRVITEATEVLRMDRLGIRPWSPGQRRCYIVVQVRLVSGQRFRPGPVAIPPPGPAPEGTARDVLPA
jgi:hypothetical protein